MTKEQDKGIYRVFERSRGSECKDRSMKKYDRRFQFNRNIEEHAFSLNSFKKS